MNGVRNLTRSRILPTLALLIMVIAYAAFFGMVSVRQHEALRTHVFDLGNVDQAIWNTIHGRPFHFTTQPSVGENRLGMHVEPILLLVALLYWIYPDPRGLLALQTAALALGAIPLYALARRRLRTPWAALAFPFAYLLLPALQAANLFEFHAVTLAVPLLFGAIYFLDRVAPPPAEGHSPSGLTVDWALYGLFVFLALGCKEDISLIIGLLGLYVALFRRRPLAGVITSVFGLVWFLVAVYVVIPHFRPAGSPFLDFYEGMGDNPLSIALHLITHPADLRTRVFTPENARAVQAFLLPLAGLPLLGFPFWLLVTPSLGITLISTNPLMHRMERYHYAAPMVPIVATAAVFGVAWLSRVLSGQSERRRTTIIALLCVLLTGTSLWYARERGFSPWARQFAWPEVTPHDRLIKEVVSEIPVSAIVTAQPNLFPHVSQRERAYFWPDPRESDYVLLDVTDPTFWNRDNAHEELKQQIMHGGLYGLVLARDGYLLLKRGAPFQPLPQAFYTFARVDAPAIRYPMAVDFGGVIQFLGFTPRYEREEEVCFDLYFRPLRKLDRDYAVTLYLIDEQGNVVGGTDRRQPTLVWYPTSMWQPGEIVHVYANTINWWTGDRKEYAVGLSILDGADIWDVAARLRPQVRNSRWITPLIADGSILQLMRFRREWQLHYPVEELRRLVPPPITYPLSANFDDMGELVGYDLSAPRLRREDVLGLTLFWRSLKTWDASYTVFVHVMDARGALVAQADAVPGGGRLPTTSWMPGEYISDVHNLPIGPQMGPGRYRVAVGLYRLDTGKRLTVAGRDQVVLDREIEIID